MLNLILYVGLLLILDWTNSSLIVQLRLIREQILAELATNHLSVTIQLIECVWSLHFRYRYRDCVRLSALSWMMMTHVIETCRVACMERWIRAQNTSSCINNSASSSSSSVEQCAWYEAPVTRTSRQLYRPVHRLARHWVLTGRQFNLSHIADVLVDNATELLVSTRSCCSRCLNILVLINCSDQTRPAWLTVPSPQ